MNKRDKWVAECVQAAMLLSSKNTKKKMIKRLKKAGFLKKSGKLSAVGKEQGEMFLESVCENLDDGWKDTLCLSFQDRKLASKKPISKGGNEWIEWN